MPVYSSVARAPTPARSDAASEWGSTVGTWKIGQRDPLCRAELGGRAKPNSETRLVTNLDPVSGRKIVGLYSVGHQGWRNQRRKEAPLWIQHQRAIAVPRELGETKVAMSQTAASTRTRGSSIVFYADAMPMEGRTVLCTPTSVKTSPPHPSSAHAQRLRRMTPSEVVPRRVRMQQQGQLRGKEDALDDAGLSPEAERTLLPNMLTDNLEVSWAALNETVSRVSAFGVPVEKFAKMLFDARWISRDSMPTLMRTYACDAGIDAALVVTDLWQCIKQPGFSAARYPAAMQLLIHSVLHVLSNLESRFRRSDDQAVESVKGTGARPQSEEPARHVDVEILSEHLRCSGFELKQASLVLLQRIYCCGEGQWKGYINYERLLADLRKAAEPYLQATSKSWNWNFTETSTTKGAQAFGAERRGAIKRAGRIGTGGEQAGVRWEGDSEWDRRDREGLGHGHRQHGAIDVWERPNTPSDILRPDSAHSSRLSEFSRPGGCLFLCWLTCESFACRRMFS
jgi:hypothetical protein